jgi:carbon monoxide dehydrogenase subunit G
MNLSVAQARGVATASAIACLSLGPSQAAARDSIVAEVWPDPGGASGIVRGQVDIAATPETVWATLLDCGRAHRMAPSVRRCEVTQRDPAGRWDVRRMEVQWSAFLPRFSTVFRSDFEPLRRIRFRCTGGDIAFCEGEWRLAPLPGGGVRVSYENRATAPFPAPPGITRFAMKMDLADALRALRRESQAAAR